MSLLNKALGGERYSRLRIKNNKTYIFDKGIFTLIVLMLLGASIYLLSINNWDKNQHIYFNCDNDAFCFNPYYNDTNTCGVYIDSEHKLCQEQLIKSPYEYGEKPPWYVISFGDIAGVVLLIGLIVNHFLYNRNIGSKDFGVEEYV